MGNKRGQIWGTLIPWIIGISVLVIVIVLSVILKDKLIGFGEYIKNIFGVVLCLS